MVVEDSHFNVAQKVFNGRFIAFLRKDNCKFIRIVALFVIFLNIKMVFHLPGSY